MIQTITIDPLWCEAIIGIYPHERREAQPLCISVAVEMDASQAIASDDITQTLDYDALAQTIKQHVEGHSYQLLESLLSTLMQAITRFEQAIAVELAIAKPKALEQMGATVTLSGSWQREKPQ